MDDVQMKELESQLTDVVSKAIETELKPLMEKEAKEQAFNQIKNVVQQLKSERFISGMDKTGLTNDQKVDFAQKFIDIYNGVVSKAQTAETPAKGGVLIPDEVYAGILKVAEDFGYIANQAFKIPMTGTSQVTVPKYVGAASSQVWEYLGEDAVGSETDVSLGNAVLNLKTAIRLVRVDNRLLKQASVGLADWLIAIFAESLAYTLDFQGFVGSGSPFTGLMNDTDIADVDMGSGDDAFTDLTPAYILQLIAAVRKGARNGAAFYMHGSIFAMLSAMKDPVSGVLLFATQNNFLAFNGQSQMLAPIGTLNGYPVYDVDVLPSMSDSGNATAFILFGNLKYMLLGESGAMEVAKSDSATVGTKNVFGAYQTAFRTVHEHALAVGNELAFARLKTAA